LDFSARKRAIGREASISKQTTSRPSQNKTRQLIERVTDLQSHEKKRCDHQVDAKMHGSLENFLAAGASSSEPRTGVNMPERCLDCGPRSIRRQ
jgi:hypothetical protein